MKFLYVDVQKRKLVAVFQNEKGENFFWRRRDIEKAKKNSDTEVTIQLDEALEAMSLHIIKPWWKFW